ncbi:MAG: DNA cytosine methyltransferase [Stenotrophomonas rhizophila]|uniref:DNA cytosine methyltransferase n=1 Tax=Stenotrophomonas rhizophila TaxID=216778 RepID=UPI003D10B3A0
MRYLSLFSGMEAAHLAWAPLGWQCVGVAEIEPAACALLRHRLPHVPNLGSVTDITDDQIKALGRIDVLIGGSPCQDLSVAGRRAGLGGARSSLFHQQMRIFNAARHFCGARWLVWENVPGAFSSNQGRDFAVVVGAMAGSELPVPAGGWGSEGVALGDNGLVEWAVLDAQWFGVAQRRRRVFSILDTGDWARRPPVLLEPDRMRGHSAPRRDPGEAPTGTLSARTQGGGGLGTDFECQGGLVAGTLQSSGRAAGSVTQQDVHAGMLVPVAFDTTQITSVRNGSNPHPGDPCHPLCSGAHPPAIAFGCKDRDPAPSVGFQVSPTLRAMGSRAGHHNAGGQVAVTYAIQAGATRTNPASGPDGIGVQSDHAYTLEARAEVQAVAVALRGREGGATAELGDRVGGTLRAGGGGGDKAHVLAASAVRRLTPRECERLQGAPDDWTLVPNAQGKPMADGPRYRMLGNSFAVPVIRWIGTRIDAASQAAQEKAA